MEKKPADDYTHTIVGQVDYHRKEPKDGDKPDGQFQEGTRVRLLKERGMYLQVESEGKVKAWIYGKGTLQLIFRLTHETTQDTPYYIGGPAPEKPADGTLKAGTKVQLLGVWEGGTGEYVVVRWTDGGDKAVINSDKHPLNPL